MRPTRLLLIWLGVLLGLSVLLGALGALQIKVPDTLHAVTWGLLLALRGATVKTHSMLGVTGCYLLNKYGPGDFQ